MKTKGPQVPMGVLCFSSFYYLPSLMQCPGCIFFNAVKEGDSVVFAADDEAESHLWVMALYRATGQSHKPAPPLTPSGKSSTIAKIQGGIT